MESVTAQSEAERISLEDVERLSRQALTAHGASALQADAVAHSIRAAEAEGLRAVGLDWLPIYCDFVSAGGVKGNAVPNVSRPSPAAVFVDAHDGFAHTAYEAGEAALVDAANATGLAIMGIHNSFACGVMGYFSRRLASKGLLSISTSNSSALVAPSGGGESFLGTNPLAFGAPTLSVPLVYDGSTAATAWASVKSAARNGTSLPDGWAVDGEGRPTNDPVAAMGGALLPMGGGKGTGLGLMVEVLSAGLTGARWSHSVPRIAGRENQAMRIGQTFIAIRPDVFGNEAFSANISEMLGALSRIEGAKVPGTRGAEAGKSAEQDGVLVDVAILRSVRDLASAN